MGTVIFNVSTTAGSGNAGELLFFILLFSFVSLLRKLYLILFYFIEFMIKWIRHSRNDTIKLCALTTTGALKVVQHHE